MTIVEGVGWVLLHFVWQGAVIALALAVLLAFTRDGQARLRYALCCGALTLMLVAALATAGNVLARGVNALPAADSRTAAVTDGATARPDGDTPAPLPRDEGGPGAAIQKPIAGAAAAPLVLAMIDRAMPWLVLGWLVGVLLLSVRLLGGWWGTRALRGVGVSPVPDWCVAQLSALAARMCISRPVAIVSSMRISVPVIVGHVKPVIVLPAAALSGLSVTQLEAILAHELAHVRRHDYLVNLAQTVIETLLFYHPAVWWVSRQVRTTREHCCDDIAVAVCRSRQEYVHALLDLEELRTSTALLALGATDGSLLARGRRLLAPAHGTPSSARLAASVIALAVVAVAAAGASFHEAVVPSPAEPSSSAIRTMSESPDPALLASQTTPRGAATSVVTTPDTSGTLASRWAWAEGAARAAQRRTYWIGYTITPVKTLPRFVHIDGHSTVMGDGMSFNGDLFSSDTRGWRFPGQVLAVAAGDQPTLKVLFALDATRGDPALTAVHVSTLSLPIETKDLAVFWLGTADSAQSLDRVDRFYRAAANLEVKQRLVSAAGVHDVSPAVVTWLERRVASQDPDDLRGNAAQWMARHPIQASVTALDRIARGDRSSDVRQEAAEALGDLALPEAAPVLIALARSLPDLDARREAVEALGARPEPAATEALASIARQDANLDVQREAVETLGDFADKRGVDVLIELARTHPHVEVRREAVETLGDVLPENAAVATLKQFLTDRDPGVQEEAVDTIAGIENTGSLETLVELAQAHTSADIRREAVEALAERASGHDSADQTAIVGLLAKVAAADRDTDVQVEAVETLGEIGGAAAVTQLQKLAGSHPDERLRAEAIESLGESGAPAAETAAFLKRIALADKSTEVQTEAIETLVELPDGAGIQALIDVARDHPVPDTRREALERLIDSDHPAARAVFERALKK
jgi:HEAT repeat protein/beta-lactamase regulating signal transducer with metallopeptidase domain